jgi:hypothetical protein
MVFRIRQTVFGSGSPRLVIFVLQGYGSGLKEEEETHMTHMNVNVTSSGQGTRTVVLQIPRVSQTPYQIAKPEKEFDKNIFYGS